MGYALIKPHLLGVRYDNEEDRKGFVHFWAVMAYMLGVNDAINMCLPSMEVVKDICRILQRYIFIPILQYGTETPAFKRLVTSFLDGMNDFIPYSSFGSRLFLNRRVAGIPGYQYKVDMSKETLINPIFTTKEHELLKIGVQVQTGKNYLEGMLLSENIMLMDVIRIDDCQEVKENSITDENSNFHGMYKKTINGNLEELNNNMIENDAQTNVEEFAKLLELKHPSELTIRKVEEKDINLCMDDHQFYKLSKADQKLVDFNIHITNMLSYKIPRYINECVLSVYLYRMKKEAK